MCITFIAKHEQVRCWGEVLHDNTTPNNNQLPNTILSVVGFIHYMEAMIETYNTH